MQSHSILQFKGFAPRSQFQKVRVAVKEKVLLLPIQPTRCTHVLTKTTTEWQAAQGSFSLADRSPEFYNPANVETDSLQ